MADFDPERAKRDPVYFVSCAWPFPQLPKHQIAMLEYICSKYRREREMSNLLFRSRKYHGDMDSLFFIQDGDNFVDGSNYHVGDKVSLLVEISPEMAYHINGMQQVGLRAYLDHIGSQKATVHIPLIVVERKHGLSRKNGKIGTLQELGCTIYVEAENGYWEDVLCWLLLGEQPSWVEKEESDG